MFWLNRQEVYMTNRVDLFHYAQQALKSGNIKYEIKNNNMGSTNRRTGRILGQFGENTSCEIMYYIYTSKSDASKAKFLIDEQIKKYAKDEYQWLIKILNMLWHKKTKTRILGGNYEEN